MSEYCSSCQYVFDYFITKGTECWKKCYLYYFIGYFFFMLADILKYGVSYTIFVLFFFNEIQNIFDIYLGVNVCNWQHDFTNRHVKTIIIEKQGHIFIIIYILVRENKQFVVFEFFVNRHKSSLRLCRKEEKKAFNI